MAAPPPSSRQEKIAGVVMSLLAAAGFGAAGVMAIWDRAVTLPGRDGPNHSSGAAAEIIGWILVAASAAFLSHLALLVRPGKAGARWTLFIVLAWGAAAACYYVVNHGLRGRV